jgi:glutaconyl-CoA/methylmalonyl-CoA decarboxylase subunit delta
MSNEMKEGLIVLIIGMGIVFLALILLQQVFQNILPFFLSLGTKKKAPVEENTSASPKQQYNTGEEITAISAAIYMFLEETHDEENAILTINKSVKNYSPWSSKIYTSHNFLRR